MKHNKIFVLILSIFFINLASAIYIEDSNTIFNMDHAIRIKSIETTPAVLSPGESGILTITLTNNAKRYLDDLIVELNLPEEIKPINDVNTFKISRLESLDSVNASFKIIVSPSADEGIYDTDLLMNDVSYLGANYDNIGEEKEDNVSFGIIVKANPEIFAQIEKTEIYKGKNFGTVTIKFVNNGIGNAKFLTVELLNSKDYEIISGAKSYIGDLDSDDFESVDLKIKLKKEKTTDLLLRATYRDFLNQEYSQEFIIPQEIKEAKELGIKTNGSSKIIAILIVLGIAGYLVWNKFKKKYTKIKVI